MAGPKAKIRKKKWVPVLAPKLFKNSVMGDVHAYETQDVVGRLLSVNLMSLTGDIKKQNISLKFKIASVQGGNVLTDVVGYKLAPASIRRLVRRGRKRIDMSFLAKTSDDKVVRIKPLLIPRTKVKSGVSRGMHKEAMNKIKQKIAKSTFEKLVGDLIAFKFQREVKDLLKKIYPLRTSEVRSFEVEKLKGRKVDVVPVEEVPEEPEEETQEEPEVKAEEKAAETPKEEVKETPATEPAKEAKASE